MDEVKIGSDIPVIAYTRNAAGELQDADSGPTYAVYANGASVLTGQTFTNVTTGHYFDTCAISIGNGFAVGDLIEVKATATVDSVTDSNPLFVGKVVAAIAEDNYSRIGANGAGLTALATAAELAKVPKSDGTATWNATALASINAEADTALADYDAPTNSEMVARTLAAASYATAAGVSAVETDTQDIQSRIPAALSGGRMAVDLQAIGNDTQSATDLKDFADTGYDPTAHWAKVDIEAIAGNASGVSNLNDFVISGYDPGLHQVLLVAVTTEASQLGTTAKADVNAEVDTALGDYDGPTNAEMEARTLVAANYATATDLATVDTVVDGIVNWLQGVVLEAAMIGGTGNSTTAIHLPGLTYGDDEINSYLLVIRDVSEDEYHARWITDWVSSTAVATVATLPFTPQDSTDTYWLLSARADVTGGGGASVTDIRIEMDTNSTKLANLDATMSSRATPAQVATELATYDGPTNAEMVARTLASASYATAIALGTTDTAVQTLSTRVGIPVVSVSDDLAAVKTDTGNLVTRITSTLFSGITSLAQMLGIMAGKQVGDTTARNELRATGAGSGTFDETTDSMQAVRDRGDAAWTTATGFAVPGSAMTLTTGERTAIANEVETQIIDDTDSEKVLEAIVNKIAAANPSLEDLTLAAIASAVRTELATELARIDAAITTRLASASYTAPPSASTNASAVRTELTAELGRIDAAITTRATPAQVATELATYDGPTNAEMEARTLPSASYAEPGDEMTLADSEDVYPADIGFTIDDSNSRDEYTVVWFRNGAAVTSGITVPTIQAIKRADGTNLIPSSVMTQIGSSGAYKYDAVTTERATPGEAVVVVVSATINGATRTWRKVITRDVEVVA